MNKDEFIKMQVSQTIDPLALEEISGWLLKQTK
jgi:hypothetical protein